MKKKSSNKMLIEEQWASEKEMKDDLGWNPNHGSKFIKYIW